MFSMAQGFNVQDRNAAIGPGPTHTCHAEGCNQCCVFWNPVWGCNMLQLHAIALKENGLESRWCAVNTAQLKALAFQRKFCAGNRVSGLSPCFKLRIRDTVKKYDLRRD